ncbi:guanine nucleotide-binding protein g(o) subunit alpha [Anaeramoeba flamelloides]|uniref:Guanine nucleotide-binding protein g(O) subunit alpha n=1 Tax=Anaeramoeba flamelloides TaxID=1746091 RepID=A0ABQ8ZF18_9EUKA|nr:guanine nucleotide-binding protein g(o) subunit alpha [Anaeramoeba flamelloides]
MGNKKNKAKKKRLEERNQVLEQEIEKEKEDLEKTVKLLLLGTGESGKSTFIKQIRLIFKSGFDEKTRELYKHTIQLNLVKDTKSLVTGMNTLDIDFEPENMSIAREFFNTEVKHCTHETTELKEMIKTLWEDKGFKDCFEKRSTLQVPDTHYYYLDNIDRITQEDYKPTDQDILYCRIPTSGVTVVDFEVEKKLWTIVDVGGQRSERRKWIHQFDDVTVLGYVVALSEYDQKLFEDEGINRMKESMGLFESTANNEFFETLDCIILFNKIDLFEKKLKKVSLKKWFPGYTGEDDDSESAKEFISSEFIELGKNNKRSIHHFYTCGTDTENIKTVIQSMQKIILQVHQNTNSNL